MPTSILFRQGIGPDGQIHLFVMGQVQSVCGLYHQNDCSIPLPNDSSEVHTKCMVSTRRVVRKQISG